MRDNPVFSDIYLFNPSCDFAVGNGSPYWQPGKLVRTMEYDLGNLPQFLSKPGDIVLAPGIPSARLCEILSQAGFPVPRFVYFDSTLHTIQIPEEPAGWLRPWGWSPATHQQLKRIKPYCSRYFLESPMAEWNPLHRDLFSKDTAAGVLQMILEDTGDQSLMDKNLQPKVCKTLSELEQMAGIWGNLMVKMPWSSSGRGLQPITTFPLHPSVIQRISGMLKSQGHVLTEPLHHKVADLAFLYDVSGDNITLSGFSRFFTDNKGQYKGNYLNGWPALFPEEVKKFADMAEATLPDQHIRILERLNVQGMYRGPLGIDTLIFRDITGQLRINPCQEINWRFTMGNISLNLEKSLHTLSQGTFLIVYDPRIPFRKTAEALLDTNPPVMREGKIYSGFIPLTEFSIESHFGACLLVSPVSCP